MKARTHKKKDRARLSLSRIGIGLMLMLSMSVAELAWAGPAPTQLSFSSPEQAFAALSDAWHHNDKAALKQILGPAGIPLISSGDPVAEKAAREKMAAAYDAQHKSAAIDAEKVFLLIGEQEFPYPIPLVKQGTSWQFDTAAGAEEILDRRIGRDELNAIEVCRAFVEAEHDYAQAHPLGHGQHEYTLKVVSSPGRRDGLYWPSQRGQSPSPLGPLVAQASMDGYSPASAKGRAPYHGYLFKILPAQGKHAPGGAKPYVVHGHTTGGFALLAYPVKYGDSGIMSFMVNQSGIVFEKNLGRKTAQLAQQLGQFDPDSSWHMPP